jgi:hypothetical protein
MRRTSSNADVTYPPEMLPRAGDSDEVEVVVCCGGTACSEGKPCGKLIVVSGDALRSTQRH